MKQLRIVLFMLVPVLLVMMAPTFLSADTATQTTPEDVESPVFPPDSPSQFGEIPSIEDGATYQSSLVSTPNDRQTLNPSSPDQLSIDIWYGDDQTFSQLGSPQLWANILGTVYGLDKENPNHSLSYTINGGTSQPLNIGPDGRRLYDAGDFNIELPVGELNPEPGINEVVIKANNGEDIITKTVVVRYVGGTSWPIPYTANWSSLSGVIQNGAQIVDGRWEINGAGNLSLIDPSYDRLVTLGDYFWKDYEVKVPITIRSWNTEEWGAPSNGGGVGLAVRWRGHYLTPNNEQPRLGWSRLGALAWYRLEPKTNPNRIESSLQMLGYGGGALDSRTDIQLDIDKTYWFKLSVQSSPISGRASTFRFKVWESGNPEPVQWSLTSRGRIGEPPTGSVLLVAHQAVVEFGHVEVTPLPEGPFTINVLDAANGQIIIDPEQPSYAYGEQVQIRAVGDTGYKLVGWTNAFSGSQNPIIYDVAQNITVGANFGAEPTPPSLTITVNGDGSVSTDAQPPYLYGQLVTLTPKPSAGYIFTGWGGDLEGSNNPAKIVLDTSKSIIANFVPASTSSPQSDDFNACSLNTDLWTFINPIGDGTYAVTGTELRLFAPSNNVHDVWNAGNNSVRVMQPTDDASFEIVTKFNSSVTQRYQIQGILVEQDVENFLRFDAHYDGNGVRIYAAKFVNGNPTEVLKSTLLTETPPYLRVTRASNQWIYSYSDDGSNWKSVGSFNHTMNVTSSGVFSANQGFQAQPVPAHTAVVDFFFNSESPIVPEDGNQISDFVVEVDTLGEGTVNRVPDKSAYQCNESVTLTAVPGTGWTFAGWSGDISGSSPQQLIVVDKNYSVTANFTEMTNEGYGLYFPMVIR